MTEAIQRQPPASDFFVDSFAALTETAELARSFGDWLFVTEVIEPVKNQFINTHLFWNREGTLVWDATRLKAIRKLESYKINTENCLEIKIDSAGNIIIPDSVSRWNPKKN